MHFAESISHVVNADVRWILRAREVSARLTRTVHGSACSLPTALCARHAKRTKHATRAPHATYAMHERAAMRTQHLRRRRPGGPSREVALLTSSKTLIN